MNKKNYKKPLITSLNSDPESLLPALAVGAALAGGYVMGRVVKSVEIRPDSKQLKALEKVCYQ